MQHQLSVSYPAPPKVYRCACCFVLQLPRTRLRAVDLVPSGPVRDMAKGHLGETLFEPHPIIFPHTSMPSRVLSRLTTFKRMGAAPIPGRLFFGCCLPVTCVHANVLSYSTTNRSHLCIDVPSNLTPPDRSEGYSCQALRRYVSVFLYTKPAVMNSKSLWLISASCWELLQSLGVRENYAAVSLCAHPFMLFSRRLTCQQVSWQLYQSASEFNRRGVSTDTW